MGYKNFDVAIYCTVAYLSDLESLEQLEKDFSSLGKHIKYSKVYLETYRHDRLIDKEKMLKIKEFFNKKGIKTSGGITTIVSGGLSGFSSFCYTNEKHKEYLKEIIQLTASIFDEIILDDFYFTNCKCESCITAKGDKTWPEFRTELLKNISKDYVVDVAKSVNANANLIIKYPNWYEHYQASGYNLKDQPAIFDMIYTGTETRDPEYTQQHLQSYLSYFLMRYMENVKPGKNGGGWFDNLDCIHNLGYYVEQAYLTLFSKSKEVTLYAMHTIKDTIFVPTLGHAFEKVDDFINQLGNPLGIACYKPFHSLGEDHLYDYLGMLGLPLEPRPEFPAESDVILLTASASKDEEIVDKIKGALMNGKTVFITSGLLKALQDKEIQDIALFQYTDRKASVNQFAYKTQRCAFNTYYKSAKEILLTQIDYSTNDSWPIIVGLAQNNNFPVLLETQYGKGLLYLLNIPDNFGDLYHYPKEALTTIREKMMKNFHITLDCESKVALFLYDNTTFIIESFLPHNANVNIEVKGSGIKLKNIVTGLEVNGVVKGDKTVFTVNINPTTYQVYRVV
jgi:hypothetical protein